MIRLICGHVSTESNVSAPLSFPLPPPHTAGWGISADSFPPPSPLQLHRGFKISPPKTKQDQKVVAKQLHLVSLLKTDCPRPAIKFVYRIIFATFLYLPKIRDFSLYFNMIKLIDKTALRRES